ncbi:molybdopterin-dependent oxidoreductase [Hymenobacter sp. BT186]|uniref:Molybdopterin-dependent oxidoreductase n=1 Tax=Hymenobacter telluris TaxID=2816474 RepID=A0A939JFV3_9BACT|nr:molybdopterin cofactor-binding domain-containing protein [Hymenobacter telluris]MBO0360822.1 molybdopterin-dependent oxidoreductase [Hymenobacter telluris]MBW3376851.1 molybdopterin-dependent oxidoreductase [Hymenobacter norwichensis]
MNENVAFFLNGNAVTVERPAADLLLIDYLRSPEVHLAGPKKPCGQGGCGGCTVIVSHWEDGQIQHTAINSCLRPVAALNGLLVTTVEGTGAYRVPNPKYLTQQATSGSRAGAPADAPASPILVQALAQTQAKRTQVLADADDARQQLQQDAPGLQLDDEAAGFPSEVTHAGVNPVAHRLAINNGSQCGYCTVGFVMNMSEFLLNNPKPTKREIEEIFDGNICRCTGYRPILAGMETFASDWSPADEANLMPCLGDSDFMAQRPATHVHIPVPLAARKPPERVSLALGGDGQGASSWLAPDNLAELLKLLREHYQARPYLLHANTGFGIYPAEYRHAKVLLDLRFVRELQVYSCTQDGLTLGAGTTYTTLLKRLRQRQDDQLPPAAADADSTRLGAIHYMARRTAGRLVRNAATLGGNLGLLLKHMVTSTEAPFPSDLATALVGIDAKVSYADPLAGDEPSAFLPLEELIARAAHDPDVAQRLVLVALHLPAGAPTDVALAQKVALRDVNAHSIVNATTLLTLQADETVDDARLVFGGLAPYPWRATKTEAVLRGRSLTAEALPGLVQELLATLQAELREHWQGWQVRYLEVPDEGFTPEYRQALAVAFLYKAIINACVVRGVPLQADLRSAGISTWGQWPVSTGSQSYKVQDFKRPVSQPFIKATALQQASGQVRYTQELLLPPGTVQGALVQSRRAWASFYLREPGADEKPQSLTSLRRHLAERFPTGFVDLITCEAFKHGRLNMQGMCLDQPILAIDAVSYVGQTLALVAARTERQAQAIADYVATNCVQYGPALVPAGAPAWWNQPVLTLAQAIEQNSIFPDYPQTAPYFNHIWRITRPGSDEKWINDWAEWQAADRPQPRHLTDPQQSSHMLDDHLCCVVESGQQVGGQAHFYLETQAVLAVPADDGRMIVHASTQSPQEMHWTAAKALGSTFHSVDVRVPSVGGAFGGKTEQTRFVVGAAVIAAQAMKQPIRLALSREQDTALIGKRHAYYGRCRVAIDTGQVGSTDQVDEAKRGLLRGLSAQLWGDGGAFYDCSFIVANCIMARADNAYLIPHFQVQLDVCRTNTAPSTAFRAFGDIQGKLMLENALDDAACAIGLTAEQVREKNLYRRGDVTPFGQALSYCYMRDVWQYLKEQCRYEAKLAEVAAFNKANRWRKRGLSMMPVKYGSGYNLVMLEQAAAVVAVYQADGSVIIHQGGVEMGQGLLTQVRQVATYILNIPMSLIRVEGPATSVIPNPTSSGASTGTSYNAEVVRRTCEQLRSRLLDFGYQLLKDKGNEWCQQQGIDFWNYGEKGWRTKLEVNGKEQLIWQSLVTLAYQNRVNLVCSFTVPMSGGETPVPNVTYKEPKDQPVIPGYQSTPIPNFQPQFDSFPGFTYSAACSVVEIDVLTGETKILSADLVYDLGWSLNPALDVGQIEGAFVQGIGYVLSEKLVFEPGGSDAEPAPDAGRLNTLNTWTYKPPATTSIPLEFNVRLFPRDLAGNVPENSSEVLSSKEVGEPPLVLAATVFFAVKAAVRASRKQRGLNELFALEAPATVQEIQRACAVEFAQ